MAELDEIVKEFLIESHENLDRLDRELVTLEDNPGDQEFLASIFRTIHTIKGSCAFLGFRKLESVAHVGENLLSRLRDGDLLLNGEITTALLSLVDAIREMLSAIEATTTEGDADYTGLMHTLSCLQEPPSQVAQVPASPPQPASPSVASAVVVPQPDPGPVAIPVAPDPPLDRFGELLVSSGRVPVDGVIEAIRRQQAGDPRRIGEILVERGLLKPEDVVETLNQQETVRNSQLLDNSIRVDVSLLDRLMNLVGELVLTRNQILQFTATQEDSSFITTSQRLNLITTELQEGVMKTRMQPIGTIWSRFPRVVRDLAQACGKEVRIEMEGRDTELDKTIIEALKDPLTHVVRNAIDHGLETPDVRRAQSKPTEGRLFLRAFHEGGQVNIEISDDGRGIDPQRVRTKALQRGLISQTQSAQMSDRELINLIFVPGFSTAEQVTNLSGRGVGMDVVKTNIEKIGGCVDIQSRQGKGTTLKIKIPLTLAIIPALIVTSGGEQFAIPQVSLLELVRLEGEHARKGIETILGTTVCRLRGNLLPLAYLNQELKLDAHRPPSAIADAQDGINMVVLQADDRQFGLVVDEINDTQEIVVKPLSKLLKGIPTFAGATIKGDGKVALILDVLGLAQRARVISEVRDRGFGDHTQRSQDQQDDRQALLLFEAGHHGRMAIPLSLVARLEEFPVQAIELAGDQEVVQYRRSILQLIRLSSVLVERRQIPRAEEPTPGSQDSLQVVVYTQDGRSLGIVVERILDIVEESLTEQRPGSRDGVVATAVIQGRITQLLDVAGIIRKACPTFFGAA